MTQWVLRSLVAGVIVVGAASVALPNTPAPLQCMLMGYQEHYAVFQEPGLFDELTQRSDGDPEIVVNDNTARGLWLDDAGADRRWDGYMLDRVDWREAGSGSRGVAVSRVSVWPGSDGQAVLSVSATGHPSSIEEESDLRGTLDHVVGRLSMIPETERSGLMDSLMDQLKDRDRAVPLAGLVPLEAEWLRLGTLYRDLEGDHMREMRFPDSGLVEASRALYTFHFKTAQYTSFTTDWDGHEYEFQVHSDDGVDVWRNREASQGGRLSDDSFRASVGAILEDLVGGPSDRIGFRTWSVCGEACVECEDLSYSIRQGREDP